MEQLGSIPYYTGQASAAEALAFIDREQLFGFGFGILDMHLLASTLITQGARLWSLDKRLDMLAGRFGVAHRIGAHWLIGSEENRPGIIGVCPL